METPLKALVIAALLFAVSLAGPMVTTVAARPPTIQEKYQQEQRKARKESERHSDIQERERSMRVKIKKARQTRRTMAKNGDDTTDIDEELERLHREGGIEDE